MLLDTKLQTELRERFNPDGSLLRQHQLRILEILKFFDKVCKENNVPYWLSAGTCLGAVRHGGFIPWDDDVDVEILREDWPRLEKALLAQTEYDLQTRETDPDYFLPFAKLRDKHSYMEEVMVDRPYKYNGVFIDIFQLEPTLYWVSWLAYWVKVCLRKIFRSRSTYRFAMKFYFGFFIPSLRLICRLFCNGNILRHVIGFFFYKKIRRREQLFPLAEIKFEDYLFPIPHDVDGYLRLLYGDDYMTLPDISNIKPKHTIRLELF